MNSEGRGEDGVLDLLRDDDFPGRNGKLIWVFVLLVFAWLFRSYRLAHLPEPERSRDSEADAAGATVPSSS